MIACLPSQRRREAQDLQRNCLSNICLSGRAGQINTQKQKRRRPTIAPDNQIYAVFFFAFFLSDSIFLSSHFFRCRFGLKNSAFASVFYHGKNTSTSKIFKNHAVFWIRGPPAPTWPKVMSKIQHKKFAIVSHIKLHGVGP